MYDTVNPCNRLERQHGGMDVSIALQDHRVFSGKRREQELENRILYLEDQLVQMNFNLSLVSNVVDLLSKSTFKLQEPTVPPGVKEMDSSRLRPEAFVMKPGRHSPGREMQGYHPYMSARRAISKSQSELRATPKSYMKEKRTYSIENLLKSSKSENFTGRFEGNAPHLTRGFLRHSGAGRFAGSAPDIPSIFSCQHCTKKSSVQEIPKLVSTQSVSVKDGINLTPNHTQALNDPNNSFARCVRGNGTSPYSIEGRDYYRTQVPVVKKEDQGTHKFISCAPESPQEHPRKARFSSMELLSSVADEISDTTSKETYLSPPQGIKAELPPFATTGQRQGGDDENHENDDEEIVDVESDEFDSTLNTSPKWSESDEDDDSNEMKHEYCELSSTKDQRSLHISDPDTTYILPDHCTVIEVIKLWEEGTGSIPPIRRWSPVQRAKQKSKISRWRKIMQIYREKFNKNLTDFLKAYSDNKGRVLPVSAILSIHKDDDSVMDEEYETFQIGRDKSFISTGPVIMPLNPKYVLPRKINGRQVTPLDILKIWERGIGSIPPIKQWTPSQKLKQQSKVSRWKKIVDLYKKDCDGKLTEFRKKFSYDDGKLMPVSAILARCETRRSGSSPNPNIND